MARFCSGESMAASFATIRPGGVQGQAVGSALRAVVTSASCLASTLSGDRPTLSRPRSTSTAVKPYASRRCRRRPPGRIRRPAGSGRRGRRTGTCPGGRPRPAPGPATVVIGWTQSLAVDASARRSSLRSTMMRSAKVVPFLVVPPLLALPLLSLLAAGASGAFLRPAPATLGRGRGGRRGPGAAAPLPAGAAFASAAVAGAASIRAIVVAAITVNGRLILPLMTSSSQGPVGPDGLPGSPRDLPVPPAPVRSPAGTLPCGWWRCCPRSMEVWWRNLRAAEPGR